VLRLAEVLGVASSSWRVKRALRYVSRHMSASGGVATYEHSRFIRAFTRLGPGVRFTGWCMPHACVTAAYAGLGYVRREPALEFLRAAQRKDGSWSGYWWKDEIYATALACEALSRVWHPGNSACLARAREWSQARLMASSSLSAFTAALLLRIFLCMNDASAHTLKHLASELCRFQQSDGGFVSSAILRIPPPDVTDPDNYSSWRNGAGGGGSLELDPHRLFTTSTVVIALCESVAASPVRLS
jgi:hypothetical protein